MANAGNMSENSLLVGSKLKPLKSASPLKSAQRKWCSRDHKWEKRERVALSYTQLQNQIRSLCIFILKVLENSVTLYHFHSRAS